ncbi:hypothetical protein BASA81_010153 [Batrachochytrium salamandrivorans]|nr:hypothetical protein BASA81_010153 [Batrachochytrium salamandrivorans]
MDVPNPQYQGAVYDQERSNVIVGHRSEAKETAAVEEDAENPRSQFKRRQSTRRDGADMTTAVWSLGGPLSLTLFASVIQSAAAIQTCTLVPCEGLLAYSVALGLVSAIFISVYLVLFTFARDRLPEKSMMFLALFLFVWWMAGVGALTFDASNLGVFTAYFAIWASFLFSGFIMHTEFTQFKSVVQRVGGMANEAKATFYLLLASLVELISAGVTCADTCSGVEIYALVVGGLSALLCLIMLKVDGDRFRGMEKAIAVFLCLWWAVGMGVLTIIGPFCEFFSSLLLHAQTNSSRVCVQGVWATGSSLLGSPSSPPSLWLSIICFRGFKYACRRLARAICCTKNTVLPLQPPLLPKMLTRVLTWLWEFVKNHKKKFIFLFSLLGLGVGGFYLMKRALMQKLQEFGEMGKKMEQRKRKENELVRIQPEITAAVVTFLPPLRKQVNRLTDVVPITTKLRDLRGKQKSSKAPASEQDLAEAATLWEDLKVHSLARMMGSIYSLTLLDLLLRVELHVAAKRGLDGQSPTSAPVRQELMLKSTEYVVSTGVERLLELCGRQIRDSTKPWLMGTEAEVTKDEIVRVLNQTRKEIEKDSWYLPTTVAQEGGNRLEGELKSLMDETYDLLESPNFANVLGQALDLMFDSLFEDLFASKQLEEKNQRYILAKVIVGIKLFSKQILATSANANGGDADGEEEVSVAVGSAATTADGVILPEAPMNRYVKRLESMPALEELSRAILGLGPAGEDAGAGGELDFLGDSMKDLLPLLQQMSGAGGEGGAPDLASLLPLLQGGMPPAAAPPRA